MAAGEGRSLRNADHLTSAALCLRLIVPRVLWTRRGPVWLAPRLSRRERIFATERGVGEGENSGQCLL